MLLQLLRRQLDVAAVNLLQASQIMVNSNWKTWKMQYVTETEIEYVQFGS